MICKGLLYLMKYLAIDLALGDVVPYFMVDINENVPCAKIRVLRLKIVSTSLMNIQIYRSFIRCLHF